MTRQIRMPKTTYMGTRQTREAREAARQADADERQHRRDCFTCIKAARQRRDDERCGEGLRLIKARRDADAEVTEQRRLDALPIEGQDPLFSDEDLRVHVTRQELTP